MIFFFVLLVAAPAFAGSPFADYPGGTTGAPATAQQEADLLATMQGVNAALATYNQRQAEQLRQNRIDRALDRLARPAMTDCTANSSGGFSCYSW